MNAEISLGDIPIAMETQDSVMKQVFQLSENEVVGDKPNKVNNEAEVKVNVEPESQTETPANQSTPKTLKQVKMHKLLLKISRFDTEN